MEGVFVEEYDGHRSYIIEAEYSGSFKQFDSKEDATQELTVREGKTQEEKQDIVDFINQHNYKAELTEDDLIFIETEEPTRLVRKLHDGGHIDIAQATAIMAHEIEHIKNPLMQAKLHGRQGLKEIREIVIQHRINQQRTRELSVKAQMAGQQQNTGQKDRLR